MNERIGGKDGRTTRLGRLVAAGVLAAAGAVGTAAAGEESWVDPSPHAEGFVTTSAGRLHYLDWGGEGDTVVLLAGLGNSAHVFDDFAPLLTRSFRVIGLTRRGFGASARPSSGYDTDTLAGDLAEALAALGLARVHLVGHSLAGDEMTRYAGLHPDRVLSVVYLDAAYDRTVITWRGFTAPVGRRPRCGRPVGSGATAATRARRPRRERAREPCSARSRC